MSTAPTSARSAAQAMTPTAPRTTWDDLPAPVRAAIEAETGVVRAVDAISVGLNSAITARLDTRTGPVFIKGVRSDRAAGQRREADLNPHVVPVAPRLHWQVDTHGWHVLGFEHIDARPARLSPGSADLSVVADTLARLGRMLPPPGACRRIEDRWADAAHAAKVDPALLTGDHLIHTDLNPHNILITQQGARVVDWAMAHPRRRMDRPGLHRTLAHRGRPRPRSRGSLGCNCPVLDIGVTAGVGCLHRHQRRSVG